MKCYILFKKYCKILFYIGSGNYWYNEDIGNDNNILYIIYTGVVSLIIMSLITSEFMTVFLGEFPEDIQRDVLAHAWSHLMVVMKIFPLLLRKRKIKSLIKELVDICEPHETETIMLKQYHVLKKNVIIYFVIVFGTFFLFIIEGLNKFYHGKL